jgi:hypothetical protein
LSVISYNHHHPLLPSDWKNHVPCGHNNTRAAQYATTSVIQLGIACIQINLSHHSVITHAGTQD